MSGTAALQVEHSTFSFDPGEPQSNVVHSFRRHNPSISYRIAGFCPRTKSLSLPYHSYCIIIFRIKYLQ